MRILVTGANGYIGTGVINKLLELNMNVVATDFSLENIDDRAEKMACNIFEINNPYEYFRKPDVLIHLAWRDGFKHNSINHINDLSNHYAFIEKMVTGGIGRVVIMGSMHEIGFYEGCINESTPCAPQSLYGISKNALRQAVQLLVENSKTQLIWLRGFYIVGNSDYGCSIFSKITQAEKSGEKLFPFTTGQNQYDFIDYNVFCNQVATASIQNEVLGIINCCSGKPEKLADRVEKFICENNYSIKLSYGTFPDRPYDSKAVWGDANIIDRIMKEK